MKGAYIGITYLKAECFVDRVRGRDVCVFVLYQAISLAMGVLWDHITTYIST